MKKINPAMQSIHFGKETALIGYCSRTVQILTFCSYRNYMYSTTPPYDPQSCLNDSKNKKKYESFLQLLSSVLCLKRHQDTLKALNLYLHFFIWQPPVSKGLQVASKPRPSVVMNTAFCRL